MCPPPATSDTDSLHIEQFRGDPATWDGLVDELPGGTAFHLHGWKPALAEGLGWEVEQVVAVDGTGLPRGLLPLVRVKSLLFGDYLVSMPFLNYGGPIGTPEARAALGAWAAAEARRRSVDLLELRCEEPLPGDLETTDRKITVRLPLPDSAETLWNDGFRSKLRAQIRRPMKEGMTARVGGAELIEPFYGIFARTMRDLGTPVLPRRFFDAIGEHLGDHVVLAVVDHDGAPAAAGFGFLHAGRYEITWAGSVRELNRLAPNMLLYWSLMEACIERGVATFDFGRCSPGSGTHRFKKQWGGADHPLPWAQWSATGEAEPPDPDDPRYKLAIDVWRRLPVPVTTVLGPALARRLP